MGTAPNTKITIKSVEDISTGMVELTQKLVNHAKNHPMITNRDVGDVKSITKLALDVTSQMTSDPFFMAKMIEGMSKDKVSSLNEWLRHNKTVGR